MERSAEATSTELGEDELRERVFYALLLPAVQFGRIFGVPLRSAREWLQMAYFHELRRAGSRMQTIAEVLDVSMRKVALLSKLLKENFARSQQVELSRRIEFMLWADPMSRARIAQALPHDAPEAIDEALWKLSSERRIALRRAGRTMVYARTETDARLVRSEWDGRLDALDNFLGNVADVVYCRFFAPDDAAFARTVSFRIREGDVARLRELYEREIWSKIVELEAEAQGAPDAVSMDLSFCWAPHERLRREGPGVNEP
jgi:hypothetical protein